MNQINRVSRWAIFMVFTAFHAGVAFAQGGEIVECANLIYAGTRSSVCFSESFLSDVSRQTAIRTSRKFKPVKLGGPELFGFPFAVMTGEGAFSLTEKERSSIRRYLEKGGFLLASAGCSNQDWDQSFRSEVAQIFPEDTLSSIDLDHPIYNTVYSIGRLETNGEDAHLEGLSMGGKLVLVYSPDGLNDTANMHGCCCCGGNEIVNSRNVNVNVITYALLQ